MIQGKQQKTASWRYIDFKDSNGQWVVGMIVSSNGDKLKVRSQGWPSKYDETIPSTSNRIKPFRSIVRGYTGQQKNPGTREHWKFQMSQHEDKIKELMTFIEEENHGEDRWIQYIRGEHYFYLDFLMGKTYSSKQELLAVYQYFRAHIQIVNKQLVKLSQLPCSEWFISSRSWCFQVFDGMRIIAGLETRHSSFSKDNSKFFDEGTSHQKYVSQLISSSQVDLLTVKVIDIVQKHRENIIPVPFLFNLVGLLQAMEKALISRKQFSKEDRKNTVVKLFKILQLNLEQLKPNDLKDIQIEEEIDLLLKNYLLLAFKYALDALKFEWLRKIKIKCAAMLLNIDSLERKLKGISELKKQFETFVKSQYSLHQLQPETFVKELEKHSVLSKIFQFNEHPEVIRKGGELWTVLYKDHAVPFDHFEYIWEKCMSRHESVKKTVLNLWTELILLANEDVERLIRKAVDRYKTEKDIFQRDLWEYESYLSFIEKLFSVPKSKSSELYYQIIEVGYHNLLKIKDEKAMGGKLTKFTKTLLLSEESNIFIKQCYIQLGKGQNVNFHILMLIEIYSQVNKPQIFMATNAFKILSMVLQTNPECCELVFRLISQLESFSTQHADRQLLSLLEFQQLWKLAHSLPAINQSFSGWLIREHIQPLTSKPVYEINPVLSDELKQNIFNKIICDFAKFDYINMSLQQFFIFKQFFLASNISAGKIEMTSLAGMNRVIFVKNEDMTGAKYMWDILMNCKNEEIFKQLFNLIITTYFHSEKLCDQKARESKVNNLMTKIQKYLRDGYRKGNYRILKATLQLLKQVIYFVKQKPLPGRSNPANSYFKFTHKIKFDAKTVLVQTSFSSSYAQIRQSIAKELKLDVNSFRLMSSKFQQISREYDEIPFCFMQDKQLEICRIEQAQFKISSVVIQLVNSKVYPALLSMVEDEVLCKQVFEILEELSIKQNDLQQIITKISKTLQVRKLKNEDNKVSKNEIFLLVILIKILQGQSKQLILKLIQDNEFILKNAYELFGIEMSTSEEVEYVEMATGMLHKLIKISTTDFKSLDDLKNGLTSKAIKQIMIVTNPNNIIKDDQKVKMTRICLNCLNIFQSIKESSTLTELFGNQLFCQSTKQLYFSWANAGLKYIFSQKIKKLITNYLEKNKTLDQETEAVILHLLIQQIYPQLKKQEGVYSKQKGCTHFYDLLVFLVHNCSQVNFEKYVVKTRFHEIIFNNLKLLGDDKNESSCNFLLKAHLDILTVMYEKMPQLMNHEQFLFLIYECLFYLKYKTKAQSIKCLRRTTISACLKTLMAGIKNSQDKLIELVSCLSELQQSKHWKIDDSWAIAAEPEKQQTYKGLQNPGCICFMNSLLQQLYMTRSFRDALINVDTGSSQSVGVVKGLKELFLEMVYSEQNELSSVQFSKTIKGSDNKPMLSIYNQMDIDEFSGILFDRLENQLLTLQSNNFVKEIFGGVFAQQVVCHECSYSSQVDQEFLTVGVQLKRDLDECLSYLVKGEILDGENKYTCQGCSSKVKAQKILSIKQLPKSLIIALKRFDYDFEIDAKIKKNDYCEFPSELNLLKYTQQEVLAKILTKSCNEHKLTEKDCQYRLKGVVIHEGSTDSGHYYSFIKEPEGRWMEFNDHIVSTFDFSKLPEEAFGTKQQDETKNKNAYLLFYEKVQQSQETKLKQERHQQSSQTQQMIKVIEDKNKQIEKAKIFFSDQYDEFVNQLWKQFQTDLKSTEHYSLFLNFILEYYLTVRSREALLPNFTNISKRVKQLLQRDAECRIKFLQKVSKFQFVESLFIYCTMRDKCTIIAELMATTFNSYLDEDPDSLINDDGILRILIRNVLPLFVLHGNVNELNSFLRIIMEKEQKENNDRVINILFEFNYHSVCLNTLLDTQFSGAQKDKFLSLARIIPKPSKDGNRDVGPKANTPKKGQSWRVFSILCQKISNQQDNELVLNDLRSTLGNYLAEGSFAKLVNDAKTEATSRTIYNCLKRLRLVKEAIVPLEKGLKDFNSLKFRSLLLLLAYIIKDNSTDENLMTVVVQSIQKILTINQKYFFEFNLFLQWIVKILHFSEALRRILKNDEDLMMLILNLLDKHKKPSADMLKKHKNPQNERLVNKLNGMLVSTDPADYEKLTEIMQDQLLCLQLGQFKVEDNNTLLSAEKDIQVGDTVNFTALLSGSTKMGTVVDIQFGKYMVKFQGSDKTVQFDSDDERLRYSQEKSEAVGSKEEAKLTKII